MITHEHALKNGTILNSYTIINVLGTGGFGITYLAKDNKLGLKVVIKEYFPNELAVRKEDSTVISKSTTTENDFKKGMQRFEEEAQTLARFNHLSIVKILGYFDANNTAYFVMEYEEGIDLSQHMKNHGTPFSQEEILTIIIPILEGLKEVHRHNYLHRDIKPGNILLRADKPPVLIDFGASKLAIGEVSQSITSMLTEGYAPLEQYSSNIKQQGSFSDLYSVGAVIYKMITGKVPTSSQTRSYEVLQEGFDPYKKLIDMDLNEYDENFLKAVDQVLFLKAKDRPQNVQEFQKDIIGKLIRKVPKDPVRSSFYGKYLLIVFVIVFTSIFGWYIMEQKNGTMQKQVTMEIPKDKKQIVHEYHENNQKKAKEQKYLEKVHIKVENNKKKFE